MSKTAQNRKPTLSELEDLARQPSSESWRILLQGLTDHFMENAEEFTEQYGDVYADVVCRILADVSVEAREELSHRVAPAGRFPDKVVKFLAQDEHSVAGPVLESSTVLSDSELIRIAGHMMGEHRLSISKRKTIGARLTDALVKSDDEAVIRETASNPGARFSESTFRLVAEKAKNDIALQEKLVERDDLLPAIVVQLSPFLSEELRARVNAFSEEDDEGGGLLDSLAELQKDSSEDKDDIEIVAEDHANVEISVGRVKSGEADLSEIATNLADQERFAGVCILLAGVAGLPQKNITDAFSNLNGLPLMVICRGLGLTSDAFGAITHLRCERLRLSHSEIVQEVTRFEELDPRGATKSLSVLQARNKSKSCLNRASR